MSKFLQEITDYYLDSEQSNSSLLQVLGSLDDVQLQLIIERIHEVEEKYGECKLSKVINNFSNISVQTSHKKDTGVTYDRSVYRKY